MPMTPKSRNVGRANACPCCGSLRIGGCRESGDSSKVLPPILTDVQVIVTLECEDCNEIWQAHYYVRYLTWWEGNLDPAQRQAEGTGA